MIIPIFISHQGCPHTCVFCDQRRISSSNGGTSALDVKNIIQQYLSYVPEKSPVEVAFYGGSFTALPIPAQIDLLTPVRVAMMAGHISKVRLSTRPDYITSEILELLSDHFVNTIELGVQSLSNHVLERSKRGHSSEDVYYAIDLIKKYNFEIGLQIMPGLPSDTRELFISTVQQCINLKPDFVRIYPAVVLRQTELETMYNQKKYTPLTLEDAVEWCAEAVTILEHHNIPVMRLGLQHSDHLVQGIVSGPYHPAFGELVYSNIARKALEAVLQQICEEQSNTTSKLECLVNPKDLSKIRGHKNYNLSYFKHVYQITNFEIVSSPQIPRGCILIETINEAPWQKLYNLKKYLI